MRRRIGGRPTAALLGVLLLVGGLLVAAAGPAAAVACDPGNRLPDSDVDGDSVHDTVVGMPAADDATGAVDVRGSGTAPLVLTAAALGAGTGPGQRFGAAVVMTDLDDDGCSDLVVSAPLEGQSAASDGAGGAEGQVHIVFGSPTGLLTTGAITVPHASSALDGFGTSLAVVSRTTGAGEVRDLYVGAPGADVGAAPDAGEVFRYVVRPDATHRVSVTFAEVRHEGAAGVTGIAETGDRFGSVLAPARGGVLVSAPLEDVGTVVDAGAVWHLTVTDEGAPTTSRGWSQDTAGVPGRAEAGDRFGSSLDARGSTAVVGVPREDVGRLVDAGSVQVLRLRPGRGRYVLGPGLTQDSPGIPGAAEAGDRFGEAVATGVWFLCQENVDLAIGAPGEDVGTTADAGTVTLVADGVPAGTPGCAPKVLRQGSGLAGATEAGDAVGSVLGHLTSPNDVDEDARDPLLVGVPLEDVGATPDAGIVQPAFGGLVANGVLRPALTSSGGALPAQRYGAVLTRPAG